eukprot:6183955-Pleurochrysis_carterae.AAC.2
MVAGRAEPAAARAGATAKDAQIRGRQVADAAELTKSLRAAIDAPVRCAPPRFASMRNLEAEEAWALVREPMPGGLRDLQPPRRARGRAVARTAHA